MSASSAAVSVGTTATALNAADADAQTVEVYNNGSASVFWGGSNVTTTIGVPIAAGTSKSFDLAAGEILYGIVATGTADVRVGRIGVG